MQSMLLAQTMSDIFKDIILSLQMECQMEIRRFTAVTIPHEGGEEGPGTLTRQQRQENSVWLLGWFEVQRIVQRNEVVIDITSAFPYACQVRKDLDELLEYDSSHLKLIGVIYDDATDTWQPKDDKSWITIAAYTSAFFVRMCVKSDNPFTVDLNQAWPTWKGAFEEFSERQVLFFIKKFKERKLDEIKAAKTTKTKAKLSKANAENKLRNEETERLKLEARQQNNNQSETDPIKQKEDYDAAEAERIKQKNLAEKEARLKRHEVSKSNKVFKEFFEANSQMFEKAKELHGLGFMSGFARRLKMIEALADGKKPKLRRNKNIDINEN
jgi:hypothetical protein